MTRHYSSTATPTEIVGDISSTVTSFTVALLSGYPTSFPFTIAADPDTDSEELMDVTGVAGSVVTVTRGVAGTTAIGHSSGAVIEHRTSHRDYQEPQDHIAASSTVHGTTSPVVGTTDTQTLTGKTIDGGNNTLQNIPGTALVSLAQAKVTGLVAALAALLANPATNWNLGSVLVGSGSGTYDTLASSGVAGDVLTVQSGGGLAFQGGAAGSWQSYTPALTGAGGGTFAIGNGTASGRYVQNGKTVTAVVDVAAGSTTDPSLTSGSLQISLPVTALHGSRGVAYGVPNSSVAIPQIHAVRVLASAAVVTVLGFSFTTASAGSMFSEDLDVSGAQQFGPAAEVHFTITYEVA